MKQISAKEQPFNFPPAENVFQVLLHGIRATNQLFVASEISGLETVLPGAVQGLIWWFMHLDVSVTFPGFACLLKVTSYSKSAAETPAIITMFQSGS